jgi:branched-subunit amino acid transport protein
MTMATSDFVILYVCVLVTMLLSRCVPLFALKGRTISPRLTEALGLIPPAAFAALVANDLFQPNVLSQSPLEGMLPIVAAVPVLVVAKKTQSLIWSALVGMAAYALLLNALCA